MKYIKLAPQLGISFFMPYLILFIIAIAIISSVFFSVNIATQQHIEIKNDGFWDIITTITTSS